jgi:hypothetical protein
MGSGFRDNYPPHGHAKVDATAEYNRSGCGAGRRGIAERISAIPFEPQPSAGSLPAARLTPRQGDKTVPIPRYLCAGLAVAGALTPASAQPYPVTRVAELGQPIPGAPGLTYGVFGVPVINSSGQVAFTANIGATTSQVTVGGSVGALQTVMRPGMTVQPGIGTGTWAGAGDPFLMADGRVGALGGYNSPGQGTVYGVFQFAGGDGVTIVDGLSHAPDLPPGAQVQVQGGSSTYLSMSPTGLVSFRAFIHGGGWGGSSDDAAMWVGNQSPLPRIATTALPLPGSPSLVPVRLGPPRLNDAGDCAFYARSNTMVTIGGQPLLDHGVWVRSGGVLSQVLRIGQQAPGMPNGTLLRSASQHVSINNGGQIAVLGEYANYPGSPPVGNAIWAGAPSQLAPVARSGQAAPGADPGSTFASFFSPLGLADNGATTFQATLQNLPPGSLVDQGIWMRNGLGELRAVALHNTHAPGSPANIQFGTDLQRAINGNGDVVLSADLHPAGSTQSIGTALFFTDGILPLTRVFGSGDSIQIAPGDVRILGSFTMLTDTDSEFGQRSGFNSARQLALRANFTNGTSAVIITQVPAPGTAVGLFAVGWLGLRRRRHAGST